MKSNIKQFVFTALLALASVGAMAQVNNVTVGETSYIASKVSFDASHMYIYLTTGETTTIDLPHDGFNISFKMSDAEIGGGDPGDKPNPDDGGKIWIDAPAQRYAAPVINDADYLCTNPDVTCALVIDADHAYPVAKSPSVVLKTTGYEVSFADGKTFTILNASAQPKVSKLHTVVTDAAVAPTCTATGKTEGSHCSVCNEVIVAQTVIPATGIHSDADNDNFCDVCGIWVSFEEPVLVTAENYEALGLDSKYVGYFAIGNLKQLAFVSSYFHGAMYKADRFVNITYDSAAPARRKAMRQAVADAQSQSIKFVLTSDITVNENLFNADGKINIYDTRGNLRSDLLFWVGLDFPIMRDQSGNLLETVFDGNGHAIRGIYQNFDFEGQQCGFAGSISSGCTICNLGISQSYFRSVSSSNAGSIVAYSEGSIDNCWSDAVIECTLVPNVGGLVGMVYSQGLIKDSYFTGSISTNGQSTNTGGIVGYMLICDYCRGRIENCHFSGRISASDEYPSASGIVCHLSTGIYSSWVTIDKCYADGELILSNNAYFGGIAEYANGNVLIYNCYNDMKLSNAGNCYGAGIVHFCNNSNCLIQYCFNYATYSSGVVFNPIVYYSYESNIYNDCCYTLGKSDEYSESATVEDFASGKIAYYLNEDNNDDPEQIVWFQKLGKDKYPVLKGDRYSIVYKDDETQTFYNEMRKMASYTIADGATYDMEYEYLVDALTYSRTIKDNQVGKWQALYVPFQMAYDDWKDTYEVAAINNFHEYYDANGNIEGRDLEIRLVKSGKTRANYPYLIRPKSAGKKDIVIENTTLYPAESNSISCASTDTRYTFTGTYQPIARIDTDSLGYIFMGGGQLSQTSNHNAVLGAQRWYLQVEEYDSMTDAFKPIEPLSSSMRIVLLDEVETGINEIENGELKMENSIYNLQGQRLNEVQKGLNIVRGRNGENKKLIVE